MPEPEPGTSKELDLDAAKAEVESTITTQTVEADITVRRRRRGTRFTAQDLLFVIQFRESDLGPLPVIAVLVSVYHAVITLIRRLRHYFSDEQRRLAFFSASVDSMVSKLYSGARDLFRESEQSLANSIQISWMWCM